MAIEWYLMKDQNLGGVESDEFTEGAEGAFEDIANSALGEDVEICNYDLTIRKPVRVVVQGAVADTSHGCQPKFVCEDETKHGRITAWFLKNETSFIYKKWMNNKPKKD